MSGIVSKNGGRSSGIVGAGDVGADAVDGSNIADDAIDSEHYAAGSIDEAHIADNAVTLAKMAGGTDGQIISWDASGDPVALGPGTDGQVLTSTGAGSPPAFETSAGVTQTQGTFTPTITGQGGGSGQSYSAQQGLYTRVGDIVSCTIRLFLTAKGTITGQLEVHDLPFTNRALSYNPTSFSQDVYWSLTADHVLRGYLLQNDTKASFFEIDHNNDNYTFLTTSNTNNNSGFMIAFTYQIAA